MRGFWEGQKRPDIAYVNAGLYKLTPEVFEHIPENSEHDFGRQVFPEFLEKNIPMKSYILNPTEAVFGIDTLDFLEKTNEYFSNKKL